MSPALLDHLKSEIGAIKCVVELHEYSRNLFYASEPKEGADVAADAWQDARRFDPGRPAWQIYDHCAALLRLYAVYSIFVEDLAADYINTLPEIYESYDELPDATAKQHRVGFGQILLKLGDSGPYRHLKEADITIQFSRSASGERPYALLTDAFFIDRQNYRTEIITKLFTTLGVENMHARIARHPAMTEFLTDRLGNESTFESELDGFVALRNEAAHGSVGEIVAPSRFLTIADFVLLTCEVIEQIVSKQRVELITVRRPGPLLGVVIQTFRAGKIAIVRMTPSHVSVGDDIALTRGTRVHAARILSLQENDFDMPSITASEGQEIGLQLNVKSKVGDLCHGTSPVRATGAAQQEQLFTQAEHFETSEPPDDEPQTSDQPEEGESDPNEGDH